MFMADECAVDNGNCDRHADCSNVLGGYECTCRTGFTGSGFSCAGARYLWGVYTLHTIISDIFKVS